MRIPFPFRRVVPLLALAAGMLHGGLARALPEPTEAELNQARERFGAARRLEDAGRWGDALALLQRVAEVKTTPQVRFHIALCMENVGLWTEALEGYAQAAGEAKGSAPDVVSEANEHIRKLEGSMPSLTVQVVGAAVGDELFLDNRPIPIDDRPTQIRANPGAHTAEARRGETVVAREFFSLDPRSSLRIELRVGSIAEAPSNAPTGPWTSPVARPSSTRGSTQRILGYSSFGLAGASAIAMGVFIGLRAGALDRLKTACPMLMHCPSSVAPTVSDGKLDAALVNVFGVITGLAAAGGAVLLVTAPPRAQPPAVGSPSPRASVSLSPAIGRSEAGISLEGAF